MRIISDIRPSGKASKSPGGVSDPGITYNEPNVSYNDGRYTYGGFYGFSDVVPSVSLASSPRPSISGYADIYTVFVPPTPASSIGPGFFMFITH